MNRSVSETLSHLRYLVRGTGVRSTTQQFLRKLFSPLFERDEAYITVWCPRRDRALQRLGDAPGVSTIVIEDLSELDAFGGYAPNAPLLEELREFLGGGESRFEILGVRAATGTSVPEIVGYFMLNRQAFSYWDGRLQGSVAKGMAFHDNSFVIQECRGMGVHRTLLNTLNAYGREQNIERFTSFIKTHNAPSIRAHLKPSNFAIATLNGTVRRVTLLSGLFERVSSPDEVLAAMCRPTPESSTPLSSVLPSTGEQAATLRGGVQQAVKPGE